MAEEPSAKKKLVENLTVSRFSSPTKNTTLHGIMTSVSPVRKGRRNSAVKYFDGNVADGTRAMRVICFNPKVRAALVKSVDEKSSIAINLKNCHVQKSRSRDDELEVVIDSSTKIDASTVEIDISTLPPVQYSSVVFTSPNQEINLQAKVVATEDAMKVKEWTKQDVTTADSTGSLKLVAWEDAVGKLTEGQCYCFTSVTVKQYGEETFLSLGPRSHFVETEDIGVIDETALSDGCSQQVNCTIITPVVGVKQIQRYPCCPSCKGCTETNEKGRAFCAKCRMLVTAHTSYSVHFLAQDGDGKTLEMTAFESTIVAAFPSIQIDDVAEKLVITTAEDCAGEG